MEVKHSIETSESIWKFEEREVPHELLMQLVKKASYATGLKNAQTVRYNAVYNRDIIQKIADEAVLGFEWNQDIISAAPVLVVVTTVGEHDGSFSNSKGTHGQPSDVRLSIQNFCLSAHENRLCTVTLSVFDKARATEIIGIPQSESVAALIPIGYLEEQSDMPKEKSTEDLLRIYE